MDKRYFNKKIVKWYLLSKRNLPWRETKDPYKIWLSEIILQQTRVKQGLPYYIKFIEAYPTVMHLAQASEQDVLRLWQGLGYYTRARNLHKCAIYIANTYKGCFPRSYELLLKLPGVGEYTAAAIASFAYGEVCPVVDGNVFRVLARIYGIDVPVNSPAGKKVFSGKAHELIDHSCPDTYNQAIMEFGATFCTPVNPDCDNCVFKSGCFAFEKSLQQSLPVKIKKKENRKRYFHYLVFRRGDSLLMRKRSGNDIWQGLFDFPLIEEKKAVGLSNLVAEPTLKTLISQKDTVVSDTYKHILTHQTIFTRFIIIPCRKNTPVDLPDAQFYSAEKITQLPKPVLITRFLDDYSF